MHPLLYLAGTCIALFLLRRCFRKFRRKRAFAVDMGKYICSLRKEVTPDAAEEFDELLKKYLASPIPSDEGKLIRRINRLPNSGIASLFTELMNLDYVDTNDSPPEVAREKKPAVAGPEPQGKGSGEKTLIIDHLFPPGSNLGEIISSIRDDLKPEMVVVFNVIVRNYLQKNLPDDVGELIAELNKLPKERLDSLFSDLMTLPQNETGDDPFGESPQN